MPPAGAVGSDSRAQAPRAGGLGAAFRFCSGGRAHTRRTAHEQGPSACGSFGGWETGRWGRLPPKGFSRVWTLERVRAEPAVLPAGWRGMRRREGRRDGLLRAQKGWKRRGKLGLGARRMFAAKCGRNETRFVKGRVCRARLMLEECRDKDAPRLRDGVYFRPLCGETRGGPVPRRAGNVS